MDANGKYGVLGTTSVFKSRVKSDVRCGRPERSSLTAPPSAEGLLAELALD